MPLELRDTNRFGPATDERISTFEQAFGCRLPAEYRRFLQTHNGGRPAWPRLSFERDGGSDETVVEWFLPLHDEPYPVYGQQNLPPDNVLPAYFKQPLQDVINSMDDPEGGGKLLPVARDPGGNLIVIECKGERPGSVSFFDHETCELVPLADSFDGFLGRLSPLPPGDWVPWLITE
jgi:SMI1/KNR4 family protein SUKH-1